MVLPPPTIILFVLILLIGIFTTITDLKSQKIYNGHLLAGAILGLGAMIYALMLQDRQVLSHVINGAVAFILGFLLHRSAVWKGGDAKLFTLYAFLMPEPVYNQVPCPPVVNLFACSFISAMLILFPFFIKDLIMHHRAIVLDLTRPVKVQASFRAIGRTVCISWMLFPVYYLARMANPVMILTVTYLIFNKGYSVKSEAKKHYIVDFLKKEFVGLSIGMVLGLGLRLWLSPHSLTLRSLAVFLAMISVSTAISTCIHTALQHFKNYHERVSFAPLLLFGCLLSYTPFLTILTHWTAQWNVLLYH